MNTKWINLTDLKSWHRGHPTGIQRTLYEILKECIEDENFKFFFFQNSPDPEFIGLSREQVDEILNGKKVQTVEVFRQPSKLFNLASSIVPEKYLKKIPKPFLTIPAKIVRTLLDRVRKAKNKIQAGIKFLKIKLSRLSSKEILEKKTVSPFNNGDTVCLLGGSWSIANLMEEVAKQKKEKALKIVTLIYDLIPVSHPHLFGLELRELFSEFTFLALRLSDKTLAISDNTKKDIEKIAKKFSIQVAPITVVRLGDDVQEIANPKQKAKLTNSRPYILCVGTLEVRKNHILIYQAYKYLIEKHGTADKLPDMFIVGGKGWHSEDICYQISNDPQLGDKIRLISNCSDAELLSFYQNCLFTVYPSVYEGWGLPIAESLKHGKFCLSSKTSSMPEIAGDILEYFSPYNSSHFAELIWEYSTNPGKLSAKEARILSDFKLTKWKESARIILEECCICD